MARIGEEADELRTLLSIVKRDVRIVKWMMATNCVLAFATLLELYST